MNTSSPWTIASLGPVGTDLMEEHLREIRSLRQRLEDSIRTNDRLRHQLEERLASVGRDGGKKEWVALHGTAFPPSCASFHSQHCSIAGAPTNIYIQGLDSLSTLSKENQALMEENLHLKQANKGTSQSHEFPTKRQFCKYNKDVGIMWNLH